MSLYMINFSNVCVRWFTRAEAVVVAAVKGFYSSHMKAEKGDSQSSTGAE